MKKNILEDLFYGNILPEEQKFFRDPEYRALNEELGKVKKSLKINMSKEDRERFDELEGLFAELASKEKCESFAYGFRLGVLLVSESFMKREDLTS